MKKHIIIILLSVTSIVGFSQDKKDKTEGLKKSIKVVRKIFQPSLIGHYLSHSRD